MSGLPHTLQDDKVCETLLNLRQLKRNISLQEIVAALAKATGVAPEQMQCEVDFCKNGGGFHIRPTTTKVKSS